ncbi:MAG: 50S ribosomal protein L22 [Elusimicrobia bacterium]|nr:50S ribosomal protein L22 [Elusimicrobiota bacterium]
MEAIAHARFQRYGSRKVAQVLDQVRGRSVWKAAQLLPRVPRAASLLVSKTLRCATANLDVRAGRKLDPHRVFVSQAWVGKGPMRQMRRVMPGPQGRALTFKRKVCHLTLVVTSEK